MSKPTEPTETPAALIATPAGYADWLAELKTRIHTAQQRATLAVNRELVLLYWQIGRDILARQAVQGWGAKLRCYVVVELKAGAFKPEHTGQLSFYLSAVDAQVKHADDNPTIGLLLCKSQNRVVAEYALRDINQPIGVAEYQLINALPAQLKTSLPSIEQIELELGGDLGSE